MKRWKAATGELAFAALTVMFGWLGYGWLDAAVPAYAPPQRGKDALRVVTWNVGNQDGEPMADGAIEPVARTVASLAPELVFLQEVRDRAQFEAFLAAVGDGWQGRITSDADRCVAVAYRSGELRARSMHTGGRDALRVRFCWRGFPTLGIFALHADAHSADLRNAQIGRAVEELVGDGRVEARMLVGDLNVDLDLDKRRDLFSSDAHRDVETYNYLAKHLFDVGIGRGATAEPDRRLDYLFVSANLAVASAGPWKGRRVAGMDHDPVVADVCFVPPGE